MINENGDSHSNAIHHRGKKKGDKKNKLLAIKNKYYTDDKT